MEEKSMDNTNNRVTLYINGTAYSVNATLTVNDCMVLSESLDNEEENYCQAIARIIHMNIESEETKKPSVEQISSQDKHFFSIYIEAILQANEHLRSYYDKYEDEQDQCHRLVLSIEEAIKDAANPIIEGISNICRLDSWGQIKLPQLPNMTEYFSKQMSPIADSIQKCTIGLNSISFSMGSAIVSSLKQLTDFSNILSNVFGDFSIQIGKLISEIRIPSISEEHKNQLRVTHRKWGAHGWTVIPTAPLSVFSISPTDQKDANKIALTYCTDKSMDELFTQLRGTKRAKQSDLDEAIFCFYKKKHRACCLVLFALIEAKLIRAQKNEDRDNRGRRPLGCKALSNIKKRIDKENEIDEKALLWLMSFETLFTCINNFFKDGNDFKQQPPIINRNFVSHGMMTRGIVRKDSVQLFLLYFNLLELLDIYYDKSRR